MSLVPLVCVPSLVETVLQSESDIAILRSQLMEGYLVKVQMKTVNHAIHIHVQVKSVFTIVCIMLCIIACVNLVSWHL